MQKVVLAQLQSCRRAVSPLESSGVSDEGGFDGCYPNVGVTYPSVGCLMWRAVNELHC